MHSNCSICADALSETPKASVVQLALLSFASSGVKTNVCCTSCGHLFHKCCLFAKLSNKANRYKRIGPCPTCQAKVCLRSVYPVFLSDDIQQNNNTDSTNECVICYDPLHLPPVLPNGHLEEEVPVNGKQLAKAHACCTPCGHVFHRHCLLEHLAFTTTSNTSNAGLCPICQGQVKIPEIYPTFFSSNSATTGNGSSTNPAGGSNNPPAVSTVQEASTGTATKRPQPDTHDSTPPKQMKATEAPVNSGQTVGFTLFPPASYPLASTSPQFPRLAAATQRTTLQIPGAPVQSTSFPVVPLIGPPIMVQRSLAARPTGPSPFAQLSPVQSVVSAQPSAAQTVAVNSPSASSNSIDNSISSPQELKKM